MRLKDKVALVTGSTTGIGEAIARLFAREGAHVMIHGLEPELGAQVVDAIRSDGGVAAFHAADLSRADAAEELVAATVAAHGGLDILINNAAWKLRDDLASLTVEGFDRLIAVNLRAPVLLAQAALPRFRARGGGGTVINIGSMNAYCGESNQLSYSIGKGALMTMCRNLADAHGPEGVRFHHFNVGWVLTENEQQLKIAEGYPADWSARLPRQYAPAGRLLTPEEIAHFALCFAGDEAALVNGTVLELEQYPLIGRTRAGLAAVQALASSAEVRKKQHAER